MTTAEAPVDLLSRDAEYFYNCQRSIAETWGIVLPSWDELSFHERLEWEARLIEQEARDS